MSIEVLVFLLRVLAGLSLVAFLLALFYIILRSARQFAPQLPTARGFLVQQLSADTSGERFALQPITTLGRSSTNTISVNDDFASAKHAQIVRENGQWWLEDRNSRNGTRLNDDLIARRTVLADGDIIGIGRYKFRLEVVE